MCSDSSYSSLAAVTAELPAGVVELAKADLIERVVVHVSYPFPKERPAQATMRLLGTVPLLKERDQIAGRELSRAVVDAKSAFV